MVVVFLADGCEEIEALTQVDYLRRAGIEVMTVGIGGDIIAGSHGILVRADQDEKMFTLPENAKMVVLPGGKRGVQLLAQSATVDACLKEVNKRGGLLCAICAAPAAVLAPKGYLNGKKATCYPGWEKYFNETTVYTGNAVQVDGNIITGRSVGVSGSFAVALVSALRGPEAAAALKDELHADWN